MAQYQCSVCQYIYDEEKEGVAFTDLPDDWTCPFCGALKSEFQLIPTSPQVSPPPPSQEKTTPGYLEAYRRQGDELETTMADIHKIAESGESIIEPMRSRKPTISWDEILIKGAQLARSPLNKEEAVNTQTVIGPLAKKPLVIETPIAITHMSFGALSREAQIALARGTAAARTAMCSGEGGILPEALENAFKFIFEFVPNRYSATRESLRRVDAIEIKIGQSAKPGMGGHLPAGKVTKEIAAIRGFPEGSDIISPARFKDIRTPSDLKAKVDELRSLSGGRPIGVKFAAGRIEEDLDFALTAGPDFVTIDGRTGATGAAPKFVKDATSVPTIFALSRARAHLDRMGVKGVSLIITGGMRISPDFAKALALGADAVAIGTAALMACGCQQYRICHTGRCPVGIATQDPELRSRFDIEISARRLENFLRVSTEELKDFARLTGHDDIHKLSVADLCTTNTEISAHTRVEHA